MTERTRAERLQRTGTERIGAVGGWAGIGGGLTFAASSVVHGWVRSPEYDWVSDPVSALEAGPTGWVQQLGFVVLSVCYALYALGLRASVRPSRAGSAAVAVMLIGCTALLVGAVALPARAGAGGEVVLPAGHQPVGVVFFLSVWVSLLLTARWLRRDPAWSGLAPYPLVAGVVCALGFVVGSFAARPDAPLSDVWGLVQRVLVTAWLASLLVLAVHLARGRGTRAG
jgi:hypothetical protein